MWPYSREAYIDIGIAYEKHGLYPLAQAALIKGIAAAPDDGRLHVLLGEAYEAQGNRDKAIANTAPPNSLPIPTSFASRKSSSPTSKTALPPTNLSSAFVILQPVEAQGIPKAARRKTKRGSDSAVSVLRLRRFRRGRPSAGRRPRRWIARVSNRRNMLRIPR